MLGLELRAQICELALPPLERSHSLGELGLARVEHGLEIGQSHFTPFHLLEIQGALVQRRPVVGQGLGFPRSRRLLERHLALARREPGPLLGKPALGRLEGQRLRLEPLELGQQIG